MIASGIQSGRDLPPDGLRLDADAVVVGSGAGGAVVAAELAQAGHRVLVLEEGPWVPPDQYQPMRPSESMRHLWRDGAMSFAMGLGDTPLINVTMGRCVGGSSLLTGGVCFRAPEPVLEAWAGERGLSELTPEGLAPWYDEVERAIHVEEVPARMRSRGIQLFAEGAAKHGLEVKPTRRNTRGCNGCGQCNFGCPHGAKLSVDRTYLPAAFAHGARLLSDCLVDRVRIERGRARGVEGRVIGGARFRVDARHVVVACGGYHTPVLLRRSGVGGRFGQVGRHLTLHPGFRMLARFDEPVHGHRGALQSAYSDTLMAEGLTLIAVFAPPGMLAATMPGFGPAHARLSRQIPHLAMIGGFVHDEGGGVVRRGLGREPFVTYRMAAEDRAKVPVLIRRMASIFLDAGARELFLPVIGHGPVDADGLARVDLEHLPGRRFECSSQHPLGSCRMGSDPAHSVVDPAGRVWGVEGLTVADGSVVPTSLGVNPQLTVMAMALRIARNLASSLTAGSRAS